MSDNEQSSNPRSSYLTETIFREAAEQRGLPVTTGERAFARASSMLEEGVVTPLGLYDILNDPELSTQFGPGQHDVMVGLIREALANS